MIGLLHSEGIQSRSNHVAVTVTSWCKQSVIKTNIQPRFIVNFVIKHLKYTTMGAPLAMVYFNCIISTGSDIQNYRQEERNMPSI
jgi:hypothetical protein